MNRRRRDLVDSNADIIRANDASALQSIATAVGDGNLATAILGAVVPAVIYHDLRTGKEGIAVDDLAAVFE